MVSALLFNRACILKVGRAWALKERFRLFWEYRYPGAARTFFTRWFWRATNSRIKPMAAVAKLIQRHLPNLLTYVRHRLTNAGLEGVNAVIQWVKKTDCQRSLQMAAIVVPRSAGETTRLAPAAARLLPCRGTADPAYVELVRKALQ